MFFDIDNKQRGNREFNIRYIFSEFNDIHRDIDRMFIMLNDISAHQLANIKREHKNHDSYNLQKIGPKIYGYSITLGADGKPSIRKFGDVKSATIDANTVKHLGDHFITSEREMPLDITATDKEVRVVLDMPGIKEEDIRINTCKSELEVKTSDNAPRKYYKTIGLPHDADTETMRFRYNNGILELTFDKKKDVKTRVKYGFVNLLNRLSGISDIF
jgi:HSP20 family protein